MTSKQFYRNEKNTDIKCVIFINQFKKEIEDHLKGLHKTSKFVLRTHDYFKEYVRQVFDKTVMEGVYKNKPEALQAVDKIIDDSGFYTTLKTKFNRRRRNGVMSLERGTPQKPFLGKVKGDETESIKNERFVFLPPINQFLEQEISKRMKVTSEFRQILRV